MDQRSQDLRKQMKTSALKAAPRPDGAISGKEKVRLLKMMKKEKNKLQQGAGLRTTGSTSKPVRIASASPAAPTAVPSTQTDTAADLPAGFFDETPAPLARTAGSTSLTMTVSSSSGPVPPSSSSQRIMLAPASAAVSAPALRIGGTVGAGGEGSAISTLPMGFFDDPVAEGEARGISQKKQVEIQLQEEQKELYTFMQEVDQAKETAATTQLEDEEAEFEEKDVEEEAVQLAYLARLGKLLRESDKVLTYSSTKPPSYTTTSTATTRLGTTTATTTAGAELPVSPTARGERREEEEMEEEEEDRDAGTAAESAEGMTERGNFVATKAEATTDRLRAGDGRRVEKEPGDAYKNSEEVEKAVREADELVKLFSAVEELQPSGDGNVDNVDYSTQIGAHKPANSRVYGQQSVKERSAAANNASALPHETNKELALPGSSSGASSSSSSSFSSSAFSSGVDTDTVQAIFVQKLRADRERKRRYDDMIQDIQQANSAIHAASRSNLSGEITGSSIGSGDKDRRSNLEDAIGKLRDKKGEDDIEQQRLKKMEADGDIKDEEESEIESEDEGEEEQQEYDPLGFVDWTSRSV